MLQILLLLLLLFFPAASIKSQWGAAIATNLITPKGFREIGLLQNVTIDKRYATANNFCHKILDSSGCCLLRDLAFNKLSAASAILASEHPGWKFIVFDAYRSKQTQQLLWDNVKGTPLTKYVAYPQYGSLHTLGLAIDLSIADETGKPLDMGTEFDSFTTLSEPRFEQEMLRTKKLSIEQYNNRLLLRKIMQRSEFIQLKSEWWHYEAMHQKDARARFKQ